MIKTIKNITHDEWLRLRTEGFGSSEVAAICGLSSYKSPLKFYNHKLEERNGIVNDNETMITKFGHWFEGGVADAFEDLTGHEVIEASAAEFIVRNDLRPYLQASPDRYYWIDENGKHNNANKGILECKTTNLRLSEETDNLIKVSGIKATVIDGKVSGVESELYIPISWYCQVQYQLLACGKQHAALTYARLSSREIGMCYIDYDQDFVDQMLVDLDSMWECIQQGIEPPATTVEDANDKWPTSIPGTSIEANEDILIAYKRIKEIDELLKPLECERKALADRLKVFARDNEIITSYGEQIASYKQSSSKEVFNDKRLALEQPDIYAKYLETKEGTKTLRIK